MTRTLRLGVRGEDVTLLQQGLNQLPSLLPRLNPDGIFGMKSHLRVQEFQQKNNLYPDGVVGPLTWGLFFELLKQIGASLPPPPIPSSYDALRPIVIQKAQAFIGTVNFLQLEDKKPKGIEIIKKIFSEVAHIELTDSNFRTKNGNWTPEPIINGVAKSWCALFAVYCYHLAGIKSINWDINSGKLVGPIKLAQWSPHWVNEIKTGDIGCVQKKSHHFIIKAVEAGKLAPRIDSIDGNTWAGQIVNNKFGDTDHHQVGVDNFNYYKLL